MTAFGVSQEENYKLIQFDSFKMKLYEYDEREEFVDRQEYFKRGWINGLPVTSIGDGAF